MLDHTYSASYADDNTPCTVKENAEEVIRTLEQLSKPLLQWFKDNKMKLNPDQFHLILSGKENRGINVGNVVIKNSQNEKLLGVFFDEKATFGYHIENMCIKASKKLQALARVAPYMDLSKRKYLMVAFFNSQFSYCPLVWRCHSPALNNKIKRLHECCLRLIHNNRQLTIKELPEKDDSVSVHIRNVQTLAIEMYKVVNGGSLEIMKEIFRIPEENGYNLRHQNTFKHPIVNSVYNGTETVSFLGPKLWEFVTTEIKELASLNGFKKTIKKWKPVNWPCRLCKTNIHHVGFIS